MSEIRPQDEADLINRFFRDHKISAVASISKEGIAGKSFVTFRVKLASGGRIASIESRLRELAEEISNFRGMPTPVRLTQLPLGLEMSHPNPEPLCLERGFKVPTQTMLMGKSYDFSGKAQEETINLRKARHILLAGETGSGKSNLLAVMLTSFFTYTSPQEASTVLIDLKNEDLVPFKNLPHVKRFAKSKPEMFSAVLDVHSELERRIEDNAEHYTRLVLVIDELGEFHGEKEALKMLSSIMSRGRSKNITVIGATQKPLASIVGSVNKSNFTTRIVGKVMSNTDAEVATDKPGTGAEHLPGEGSFLRIEQMQVRRLQAYFMENVKEWTRRIPDLWMEQAPMPWVQVGEIMRVAE